MNNKVLMVVMGIVILTGLFFLLKPKDQVVTENSQSNSAQPTSAVASPAPTEEAKKTFTLNIKDKKLVSGPATIKVMQGDEVVIQVTADEAEEFHIHGYDKFTDLEPNKSAELSFTANLSGRFVAELEHSKTDIVVIEVQPK